MLPTLSLGAGSYSVLGLSAALLAAGVPWRGRFGTIRAAALLAAFDLALAVAVQAGAPRFAHNQWGIWVAVIEMLSAFLIFGWHRVLAQRARERVARVAWWLYGGNMVVVFFIMIHLAYA